VKIGSWVAPDMQQGTLTGRGMSPLRAQARYQFRGPVGRTARSAVISRCACAGLRPVRSGADFATTPPAASMSDRDERRRKHGSRHARRCCVPAAPVAAPSGCGVRRAVNDAHRVGRHRQAPQATRPPQSGRPDGKRSCPSAAAMARTSSHSSLTRYAATPRDRAPRSSRGWLGRRLDTRRRLDHRAASCQQVPSAGIVEQQDQSTTAGPPMSAFETHAPCARVVS